LINSNIHAEDEIPDQDKVKQVGDINELIRNHGRRLQELRKKTALLGYTADPSVSLEIEDIEMKIAQLQAALETLRK
jgi:hypothetical protein